MQYLCFHSKTASFLLPNWEEIWNVNIDLHVTSNKVICNEEIKYITCKEYKKGELFLAAVFSENKIHILYTVTKRQTAPICVSEELQSCSTPSCLHFKRYLKHNRDIILFDPIFGGNALTQEATNSGDMQQCNDDESPRPMDHYLNELNRKDFAKLCGYNYTKIIFPFKKCPNMKKVWQERMQHVYNIPPILIPPYDPSLVCEHGHLFDSNDDNLVTDSNNVVIINENGEMILESKVMLRKALGNCRDTHKYDGHPLLLWHLGSGRFVNYTLLSNYLHNFVNDGLSIKAMFESIKDNSEAYGVTSSVVYSNIHRATIGFFRNLQFDDKYAFSCPNHGVNPKWIVADGKNIGPTKSKCKNLNELDCNPDDTEVLSQSTTNKDRTFLSNKIERSLVCSLFGNQINLDDFIQSPDITSENGILIRDLIEFIDGPEEIALPYKRFIKNVCKPSSVRGLLQVTNFMPIEYLGLFCRNELDIKNLNNLDKLRVVSKELPVFWPMLNDICDLETSAFLPPAVSQIVLKMLDIRKNTFIYATRRNPNSYILYDGPEHPTMCYPNHRIVRLPKKYKVNNTVDADLCKKAFIGHSDFTAGIFSVGCGCEFNTTFGFELMINKESQKNLFRLLQCRDFNHQYLEGILIDHACLTDRYILNREADMLEWKRLLVDGAHWRSQKKF